MIMVNKGDEILLVKEGEAVVVNLGDLSDMTQEQFMKLPDDVAMCALEEAARSGISLGFK